MNNDLYSINKVLSEIQSYKKVCLISHVHPDGDSLGSLLSLGLALKQIKKNGLAIALSDQIPSNYNFLPEINRIQKLDIDEHFDLLITLDCADKERIGINTSFLDNNVDKIINIDHHVSNTRFGNLNLVIEDASSTGEIIYQLIKNMSITITSNIATCLYVALSTDTGSFKYDSTSAKTHLIASELIKIGIDINKINTELYQSKSLEKTKLFIESLNSLELFENNRIGIAVITKKMFKRNNAQMQDADSIVEFIRDIDSVEVACILKEADESIIKVGLRSKHKIDVAEIAKAFNGGGHVKASGCTIHDNVDNAKSLILDKIKIALR